MRKKNILKLLFIMIVLPLFIYSEDKEIKIIKNKKEEIKRLTENAAIYFLNTTIENACNSFINDDIWRKGELFIFVFDEDGNCYAHGDDTNLIWKNLIKSNIKDGHHILKLFLSTKNQKGYIGYIWNNAYQSAYIQIVEKNKKRYILGSGFYPENNRYKLKQLVLSINHYFNKYGARSTFEAINNKEGLFSQGNIHSFAYDINGKCMANEDNIALVGQNLIENEDENGEKYIKKIVDIANSKKARGWVSYYKYGEKKDNYIVKVKDHRTKKIYLIGAGYYPNISLQSAKDLVNKAANDIQVYGSKEVLPRITSLSGGFFKGSLKLFVYNEKGECLANGENPKFVGQNLINYTDQYGKYIVKDIIKKTKDKDEALISYTINNDIAISFIRKIKSLDGTFLIGSTYYPTDKKQTCKILLEKAINLIKNNSLIKSLDILSSKHSSYIKGDLYISIYNENGIRLVNGPYKNQIWKDFLKSPDQLGNNAITKLIESTISGDGWSTYTIRNAQKRVFSKRVKKMGYFNEKNLETLIVSCGYFL